MRGFQYLLIFLFGSLTIPFASTDVEKNLTTTQDVEAIISSDTHQNELAIIDFNVQLHQIFDTPQPTEFQVTDQFYKTNSLSSNAYGPTLLYYNIGNAIELHLSSTTIIFPFHCFT
ncbi:MAG: hypothetical protein ACSHXF_01885 [Aquaticitalea sp.]